MQHPLSESHIWSFAVTIESANLEIASLGSPAAAVVTLTTSFHSSDEIQFALCKEPPKKTTTAK
jgi:hypothetical protein